MGKIRGVCLAVALCMLAACGGGGDGGDDTPTPPDLSGVWSGAWQGSDPRLGIVSGSWEVRIVQGANSATGAGTLLGDVDCMDGQMQTNPNAQTAVTGTLNRPGCPQVSWTLTALDVSGGAAAGTWSNQGTGGSGSITGTRIARLNGPRIRFVSPPGGNAGAIVTIVGENLSVSGPDSVVFGNLSPFSLISADATRIVATVPGFAATGAVQVGTAGGFASSPFPFNTNVSAPLPTLGGGVTLTGASIPAPVAPAAVAISPDGRKFYVADRGNNTVKLVRASTLALMQSVNVGGAARSIVASPDGKRVYVAVAGLGVRVLDAANLFTYHTALLDINDGGRDNPQGIAISPDGRTLIVSDGKVGGIVTVYLIAGDALVAGVPFTLPVATQAPLGVAFSPDGTRAYVAGADATPGIAGSLHVFNPANGNSIDSDTVGMMPTAIAVSPDGTQVFVTNKDSDNVNVYDGTNIVGNVTVGNEPTGIAFAPGGGQVFVTNRAASTITIINAASLGIIPAPNLTVLQAPLAIAINSRGTTAYIAQLSPAGALEIGGLRVVTVVLSGTGIGSVRSSDSRISCGTACQAEFPQGDVTLTATAGGNSSFGGWSGGCSGFSSSTTFNVSANTTCFATFNANTPPPSQQNQQQQGCFIATAAYGSDMAREVQVLREFRGRWLMTSEPGRALVRFYYRNSPPLADLIRERDGARAAVRAALMPVVWSIEHPAAALWLAGFCVLLVMGWRAKVRTDRSSRGAA